LVEIEDIIHLKLGFFIIRGHITTETSIW